MKSLKKIRLVKRMNRELLTGIVNELDVEGKRLYKMGKKHRAVKGQWS